MKQLKDILYKVSIQTVIGDTHLSFKALQFDSRKITQNDVFVALSGTAADGHQFIPTAIRAGAVAVICEKIPGTLAEGVTYVETTDTHAALSIMAANFYGNPSQNINLVGITGTNGKTTVATLLYQLFKKAGYKVGLLSTVRIMVNDTEYPATHTTPDSLTLNHYLKLMGDAGAEYCFMEVSSHGIHQKRTEGLQFRGGIFTNLTHDHLDYHSTFAEYRNVKKSFFDQLPKTAFALTNIDDKNGAVMLQNTRAQKHTYALQSYADFRAQVLENQFNGLLLKIEGEEVWTKLIGSFNAYNLIAVYAAARLLGLEKLEILQALSQLESVRGRFQYIISGRRVTAIVDYAHTPDALRNVLQTINNIRSGNETLITVVGCGGDRDKTKRPIMGEIASELSDKVIFTSDNPRSEDPAQIASEMEKGVPPQHYKKTLTVLDRKQAIKTACQLAQPQDIILVAGKGHETYQEIKGVKTEFDDMKIIKEVLT